MWVEDEREGEEGEAELSSELIKGVECSSSRTTKE